MAVVPTVPAAPASLYVGDLHPEVTDSQLFDAFSEFKSLASVRICRDSSTGRSLCYGYVNYISLQEATKAIEAKNNSMLHGKVIRVMWSHRDPDGRRSGIGNVFVKNLSDLIDNAGLHDMFAKFGSIFSSKVAMSEDGMSKCYGFIQFETEESANDAIEKLNGSTVGDRPIYVGKFVRRNDRVLASPDAKYTNLYVKNLDPEVGEELLREKFYRFGKIASLVIVQGMNGMSKGFGFINFENSDDAWRAMEEMNGAQLGSEVLYVARAQKKSEREQVLRLQFEEKRKEQIMKFKGLNVYVKNIGDYVTDEEFRELFSQCGAVTSAKLMRDDKGISKGFGFVCFSTLEEANKAVNTFHGYMFHGKPLYAAIAQRKEDRQVQLQIQHAQLMAGLAASPPTLIPGAYPPYYYAAPAGVGPQVPPRPGLMYQPLGLMPGPPGWRANSFAPLTRPGFQQSPVPVVPNTARHPRQNRVRMNGQMLSQKTDQAVLYMQNSQQTSQSTNSSKESSNQQQAKYVPNGRPGNMNKSSGISSSSSNSVGIASDGSDGPEMLSSMLAAASPNHQKQILGERLYPLVQKHRPELTAKITGMLLEMDNTELLLLLESPESLAAKVKEAVKVLEISKNKVSGQDVINPGYHLSAEVSVN